MSSGGGHMIKLSPNMRPYVARVIRGGLSQRAFKNVVGSPAGACVRAAGSLRGKSQTEIRKIVGDCGRAQAGTGKVRAEIARLRGAG